MTIGITQRRVWLAPARAATRRGATQQKENRQALAKPAALPSPTALKPALRLRGPAWALARQAARRPANQPQYPGPRSRP